MKIVLFVSPHLSTGGLPQYLYKKIEVLNDTCTVHVVEYNDVTGGKLVVQRDRIRNILPEKQFHTLPSDKTELLKLVSNIQPDILHIEEIPELFMDSSISDKIYNDSSRKYKIIETSHDSSFDIRQKIYFPDKFIFVSQYQVNQYKPLNIPCELVEYPIEDKQETEKIYNKKLCQNLLGFDPTKKHIINVGLFTPRKNQAEIFEYARKLQDYPIQFHFIGNQADNFKFYWEPLMKDIPSNVKWWGERADVDRFYQAADLFLFTSRGTDKDKETMPLVIREAISWKVPSLIYNLPVYLNYFNKYNNISYLDFHNPDINIEKIKETLDVSKIKISEEIIIISSYPNNSATERLTEECIKNAKKWNKPIILASHHPVSIRLQNLVNYVVYDSNNILTKHDFYSQSWYDRNEYYALVNIKKENNDMYHGPAVYTNYYNAICLAYKLGYKTAYCHNFDMKLEPEVYERFKVLKGNKLGLFSLNKALEGNTLRTVFHVIDTSTFENVFTEIKNETEYNNWAKEVESESNGLENMYYHTLKWDESDLKFITDEEYYKQFEGSEIDICSCVEYYTVLAVENQPNKYAIWFSTQNKADDRYIWIKINGKIKNKYHIENITQEYIVMDKDDHRIEFIIMDHTGSELSKKEINVNKNYNFQENGYIKLK